MVQRIILYLWTIFSLIQFYFKISYCVNFLHERDLNNS